MNVCLSKWEREGASWCLLRILQKLPRNFSDTSRGRGWPDGCPLVGCRQGGVHESHCEEDGECERHDDQRATELHSAAPSPRHVTSRVTRTAVTRSPASPRHWTCHWQVAWFRLSRSFICIFSRRYILRIPIHKQCQMWSWYSDTKPRNRH